MNAGVATSHNHGSIVRAHRAGRLAFLPPLSADTAMPRRGEPSFPCEPPGLRCRGKLLWLGDTSRVMSVLMGPASRRAVPALVHVSIYLCDRCDLVLEFAGRSLASYPCAAAIFPLGGASHEP